MCHKDIFSIVKFVLKLHTTTILYCCRKGIHCCVRPQPLLNKDKKVKDNKQKPKGFCPAGTTADREPQPIVSTSSPACSNTFVSGCVFLRFFVLHLYYSALLAFWCRKVFIFQNCPNKYSENKSQNSE